MANRNAILNALRKQQDMARQRVGRARAKSVPMPVGGWNTRDSNTRIGPQFAETFTNVISSRDGVHPRKSPLVHASVDTTFEPGALMVHNGTDGTDTMFCVSGSKIWDVTAGGFVNTPTSVDSLTNNILRYENINGRLVWANGADSPQSFDGTWWSVEPLSLATGEPAVTFANLAGLFEFKNRVYWWQPDQMGFYYSTLNTIGDALKFFDLSYVAREGGDLLTITRYTVDGGSGPDDYPVFITSNGEAIIYQGTNPNDAAAWSFVGSFRMGKPPQHAMPQRQITATQWGAQSYVITENDYVALPQALMTEGVVKPTLLSGAIQDSMNSAKDKPGWQAFVYQKGPWLMFNVPVASATATFHQHIIDLHTQAPSLLTGINGRVWATLDDELYCAGITTDGDSISGNTKVYKALATSTAVDITIMSGASNLGIDRPKVFNGYRVWASTSASGRIPSTASATTRLRTNYTDGDWTGDSILRYNEWVLTGGVGTYVQFRINGPSLPTIELKHVEYIWETGDPLISARY